MINKECLENFLQDGYVTLKKHKQFIANIDKDFFFNLVDYLLLENKRQAELNKEEQKLNGELQKRITELEEICKGKSIQEMGTSNLYKEDKR